MGGFGAKSLREQILSAVRMFPEHHYFQPFEHREAQQETHICTTRTLSCSGKSRAAATSLHRHGARSALQCGFRTQDGLFPASPGGDSENNSTLVHMDSPCAGDLAAVIPNRVLGGFIYYLWLFRRVFGAWRSHVLYKLEDWDQIVQIWHSFPHVPPQKGLGAYIHAWCMWGITLFLGRTKPPVLHS